MPVWFVSPREKGKLIHAEWNCLVAWQRQTMIKITRHNMQRQGLQDSRLGADFPVNFLAFNSDFFFSLQLISLFPNMLPSTSNYTRSIPPLHQYADISQVYRGDVARLAECKKFLVQYLEQIRDTDLSLGNRAVSIFEPCCYHWGTPHEARDPDPMQIL